MYQIRGVMVFNTQKNVYNTQTLLKRVVCVYSINFIGHALIKNAHINNTIEKTSILYALYTIHIYLEQQ
jgi:hypothetical protein